MSKNGPCLGCEERYLGCHAQREDGSYLCERFGAWQRQKQELDRRRMEDILANNDVRAAHAEGAKVNRNRKKRVRG